MRKGNSELCPTFFTCVWFVFLKLKGELTLACVMPHFVTFLPHFVIPDPLCNFWAASLCNYFAPLGNQKKLPHFVILCLYNTWRVSCGGNSLKTKLQKIMIRKRPHPFMTSSFSPFWYWKYDTLISLDCVAHFRPNSVRMILKPKGKLYILNMDLNHLWRHNLVHFGTGNMTLISLNCVAHFRPNSVRIILRPKG